MNGLMINQADVPYDATIVQVDIRKGKYKQTARTSNANLMRILQLSFQRNINHPVPRGIDDMQRNK
jgi:hypothetical protein